MMKRPAWTGTLYPSVILFFLFLMVSCTQDEHKEVSSVELPDQIVENFQMQESASGKERYFLKGTRAFYYNKKNIIIVHSPRIEFYGAHKEVDSEVVCDSGIVNNRTGDLIAYGHVLVMTGDGTELRTDSLVWFNQRAEIETDALVHITSPQGTVEGRGLISDANLYKIEIKEEVTGTTDFSIEGE